MIKETNIETLYDVLDESAILMYEKFKMPYLKGLVRTSENIIANSVDTEDEEVNDILKEKILSISSINFQKEEIRKAFQYAILKGLKHENISNQMMTPESIGMLMSYLIQKLYDLKHITIYDPLIGTGNLLASIANQIDIDVELFGVENFGMSYELSQALFGMLGYGNNIFFQDTLTSKNINADMIVSDFSAVQQSEVYKIINHQLNNIKPDGYFIFMVDNMFFEALNIKEFIKEINKNWYMFGMMVLPKEIFKTQEKTIIILQNKDEKFVQPDSFMMVEIPGFKDSYALNNVIGQLNEWFKKTKFYQYKKN
ncbi:MAG: N-6 DNA methylase [Tenericutes bacterium]|jgi:site-specific DNA-methyltransferase (adenine-specific)|nr:N-6 DNA methylase [Mycoplasmatota bacterium]